MASYNFGTAVSQATLPAISGGAKEVAELKANFTKFAFHGTVVFSVNSSVLQELLKEETESKSL